MIHRSAVGHFSLALMVAALWWASPALAGQEAREALRKMGLQKGVCAVLGLPGRGKAAFVADLARGSELLVYFQTPDADEAAQVKKAAVAAGLLGTRVFVDTGEWKSIHLADNLAGAVWVGPAARRRVAESEVLRVLHPEGRAILGRKELVKPFPKGIDAWSHPYHGPDNNPQSTDQLARAPYRTQFLAEPKWCPMPQVSVAAGGRLFKAYGHIAHKRNQVALLNRMLCINAYNGTILWTRPLREGFMIHRNTLIATPDTLYLADDEACKLIDTATGKEKRRITIPRGVADGTVWKWMAMEGDTLYALIGGTEVNARTIRRNGSGFGHWPWGMWQGHDYRDPKTNFGFGRTLVAINPVTGKILWRHSEREYLDSRGVCMKNGRIYFYSPGKFLGCLVGGKVKWKTSDPELLGAIGPDGRAQHWKTGYTTTTYVKCNDKYIFFAGPQRPNLVAVRTVDGKLAWQRKDGNYKIVLRKDAMYAAGTQTGSYKLAYDTGKQLRRLPGRGACTRATGSVDSVFYRGGGTLRIDTASSDAARVIAPMRPPCQDGVLISDGLLYWGPWMCGCNLSLYGHISLGPAGDLRRTPGVGTPRLESARAAAVRDPGTQSGDWPSYRGNNERTSVTAIAIPGRVRRKWTFQPPYPVAATAPVVAGGTVFVADRSGAVRAIDAANGKQRWQVSTGGAVFFPPAVWKGRVYAGSADGWVYALEAATGRLLWRYRVAPERRWIPVYGRLSSTWPVAGGVVVQDGTLYAAAGIAHYDGTHVCALDAVTGRVKWHNDSSGQLSSWTRSGISLQGSLSLNGGKLRFSGGNACPDATFDLRSGKCLTPPPRGAKVATVFEAYYPEFALVTLSHTFPDGRTLDYRLGRRGPKGLSLLAAPPPGQQGRRGAQRKTIWNHGSRQDCRSFIVGPSSLVVAGGRPGSGYVAAFRTSDGAEIWKQKLSARPVRWGTAMDAEGRLIVSLTDGRVVCFAGR